MAHYKESLTIQLKKVKMHTRSAREIIKSFHMSFHVYNANPYYITKRKTELLPPLFQCLEFHCRCVSLKTSKVKNERSQKSCYYTRLTV